MVSDKFLGSSAGLTIVSDAGKARVSSSFNSGIMPGAIKGAWLADTTAESLVGSELVTNGTFDTDTAWTKGTGWTITGGQGVATAATNSSIIATDYITTVAGKTYTVSADVVVTSGTVQLLAWNGTVNLATVDIATSGTYSITFKATNTTVKPYLGSGATPFTGTVDNLTMRLADPDRSVNNKGLQTFGTITKAPVATGAELMAYSGFSATNYLEQPYNSALDFGTGDFYVIGWIKTSTNTMSYRTIASRYLDADNGWNLSISGDGTLYTYFKSSGAISNTPILGNSIDGRTSAMVAMVRKSDGSIRLYVDGVLYHSANYTVRSASYAAPLMVGQIYSLTHYGLGGISLLRIGSGAPSAEDIAYIYNQERELFKTGAKCTLVGSGASADAITSMDWNSYKEQLYATTSAGLSVFDGLSRVSEDTSANMQSAKIASESIYTIGGK